MLPSMLKTLHPLSAVVFYALGLSFFVAYLLLRNGIAGTWPGWWLQVADLPVIIAGGVYGGMSMYKSLTRDHVPSRGLAFTIGIPLAALLVFLVILNFWGSLPSQP